MSARSLQPPRGRVRLREGEARYLMDLLSRDSLWIGQQIEFYNRHSDIPAYAEEAMRWRDILSHTTSLMAELLRTAEEMGWALDH